MSKDDKPVTPEEASALRFMLETLVKEALFGETTRQEIVEHGSDPDADDRRHRLMLQTLDLLQRGNRGDAQARADLKRLCEEEPECKAFLQTMAHLCEAFDRIHWRGRSRKRTSAGPR